MLGALSESFAEGDGEVMFLDRDGPSFRYILNYLRDPFATPLLPRDPTERDQLAREADFYGLPGLLSSSSTAEAAGGNWESESACARVLAQSKLYGSQSGIVGYGGRDGFEVDAPVSRGLVRTGKFPMVRKQYPCHDLRGLSLHYMNLGKWNLRGCNLAGVDATGADFTGANLSDANLSGANLQEATLLWANLQRCKFTGANVRRASFRARHREFIEREAAPGDYYGPPYGPAPRNIPPTANSRVGASFSG